jgi:hypothetical protein
VLSISQSDSTSAALPLVSAEGLLAQWDVASIDSIVAAAGYNFRRLLAWLAFLLRRILSAVSCYEQPKSG